MKKTKAPKNNLIFKLFLKNFCNLIKIQKFIFKKKNNNQI